ncbi:hypothetical protein CBR_g40580 [Chara braunii]|uniref:Uncharacterized protein n=1 Tax=Chara braunii TaxID=69332 RepID=A0A388K2F5_CHABU|nr:hypothetical protein CBR_g40580 [Chara braunii]|eukprot:GBG64133.1 hypothetical protein CBR_g40580 [Chara braunii]
MGWRGRRRSGGTILFRLHKVGGLEVLNGELGGVERGSVEVVIGGGWSGVVMEKAGVGGSGRGLVMGVEESIVVKHAREEVSKGHVGFVGEGCCKVFVAYSFDAGDERKVGNAGGGKVVAEGPDVLDEAVRGTGLAEVAELFKVVINGFLGAEGGRDFPIAGNDLGEGVEVAVIGGGVVAGVVELVVVLKEVVGGKLWHCRVRPGGDLGIGGTEGGDGGGRHDGLGNGMRVQGGKRGDVDGRGMRRCVGWADPGEGVEVEVIGGGVVAGVV